MLCEQADYWGTIEQIDAAVGRVRSLLVQHGVAQNTWVSFTADNGPEVSPSGGQGTSAFTNPGRTAGLRGRKRDVTEGGTRVPGLIEFPLAMRGGGGRVEQRFPISTMDLLPTVADMLGVPLPSGRPVDGISLLPFLRGEAATRPRHAGIGIHGSFPFGDTNHQRDPATGVLRVPFRCPKDSASVRLGDVPANFESAAAGGWQFSWAEGNDLKMFGCNGYCNGLNCNSTSPGFANVSRSTRTFAACLRHMVMVPQSLRVVRDNARVLGQPAVVILPAHAPTARLEVLPVQSNCRRRGTGRPLGAAAAHRARDVWPFRGMAALGAAQPGAR